MIHDDLYTIDLEVKPNTFIMGYRKATELHSDNFILKDDVAFTYNLGSKVLEKVDNDHLLKIYRVLNSKLVAHNGYNYDFPIIEVVRNYLYYNIDRRLKQCADMRGVVMPETLFENNVSINTIIYELSKCIISVKPYFISDYFKANKANMKRVKKDREQDVTFSIERRLTAKQSEILHRYFFNKIAKDKSLNIGLKLWILEQTIKSNQNYFDSMCCFQTDKEPSSLSYVETVYMKRHNKSSFETDWDAPVKNLEELHDLIVYNYNDIDVLVYLINHNKFKDHFNMVKMLEKTVGGILSENTSGRDTKLVFNGMTAPELTAQWVMSLLTANRVFLGQLPLYNNKFYRLHYSRRIRDGMREINSYGIEMNLLVGQDYKPEHLVTLHDLLHPPISRKLIDASFDIPVIKDFEPLINILNYIKKDVIGSVHESASPHTFNMGFKTELMDRAGVDRNARVTEKYSKYIRMKLSLGGLHTERLAPYPDFVDYLSLSDYKYVEFDVSSFYPWLIIKRGLMSDVLKECGVAYKFAELMERRLACKRFKPGGDLDPILEEIARELGGNLEQTTIKTFTSTLKLILNSLSGLFQSTPSICFNPLVANQLRLIGQTYLTILIQRIMEFDFDEFRFIYANTDGIMVAIKRDKIDHYTDKFNAEAQKLSLEAFNEKVPFESEHYDTIKYADINNIVKIKKFSPDYTNVLNIGAALRGAKFKFVDTFSVSAKASYASRIIALNNSLLGIDIKTQVDEIKSLKSSDWYRAIYSAKLTPAYRAFALADPEKLNITELDRRTLDFYPSKSSNLHLFQINSKDGKLKKFADFNVKVISDSDQIEDIIKSPDFDWDTYIEYIENDVKTMSSGDDEEVVETEGDIDPTDVAESLFEIYKRKSELEEYGLMTQPTRSRDKAYPGSGKKAGKSEYEFKQYCKVIWEKHGNKVGIGGTKAINVFVPSNYIILDVDKPELIDEDLLQDLTRNSNYVVGREGSDRFKCVYKLPYRYVDHNLYLQNTFYKSDDGGIESAIEIVQGGNCSRSNKAVTMFGAHTFNKQGECVIEYKDIAKPNDWSMGPNQLSEEMIEKYFRVVKVKNNSILNANISQCHDDVKNFYFARSERPITDNPYIKHFKSILVDHIPLSNTYKTNLIWSLMKFGYDTGTMDLIIHALRHYWSTYNKLESSMKRFNPCVKRTVGIMSIHKYFKDDKKSLQEITRKILVYPSNPKEVCAQKDFGSDLINAMFILVYKEVFPYTTLFDSEKGIFSNGTIERYKERFKIDSYLLGFGDLRSVALYNILNGLGIHEFSDANGEEINLLRYIFKPNTQKPEIRYDDPVLERDIGAKEACPLDVRRDFDKLFTVRDYKGGESTNTSVHLLNAPTGCGKTCSAMKRLAELSKSGYLSDGCAVVLTSTHLEVNTVATYLYNDLIEGTDYDEFIILNGSTNVSKLIKRKFNKDTFKDLSVLEKREFFNIFKIIFLNSSTSEYTNDIVKWFENEEDRVKDKIFLLMAHYLQPHRMNGEAYNIAESLLSSPVNIKYTFIDEVHKIVESMRYEMIASDLIIRDVDGDIKKHENRLTTLFDWGDKIIDGDKFILGRGVQDSLTPRYKKCHEFTPKSDLYELITKRYKRFSEPIQTTMYEFSYYTNPMYHLAFKAYEFTQLSEYKKELGDDVKTKEGALKFKNFQIQTFIDTLIETASVINVTKSYPTLNTSEGHVRVGTVDEYITIHNESGKHVFMNKHMIDKFDDDPTCTPFAPILSIYNTRLLTKLIYVSQEVVCATATWLSNTKKIMEQILPKSVHMNYWYSLRKEEEKLSGATLVIPACDIITSFDYETYKRLLSPTNIKMLFLLPKSDDVQRLNNSLAIAGVNAAILKSKTIDLSPNMTNNLNNLYRIEDNRAQGTLNTAISSALGASGTGLNLPEYSIVYTSLNAHKTMRNFTLISSKQELIRAIYESLGSTAIQNIGRVMRLDLNKDPDNQYRAIIVDGVSRMGDNLANQIDQTISKAALSLYLREAILYYVDQNVKEPTIGTLMMTEEDEDQVSVDSSDFRKYTFEHCISGLIHFVNTGEEPSFDDFLNIVLNPDYKKELDYRDDISRDKAIASFDTVKQYNFDFKRLAKDLGIKRTDINYEHYIRMVLSHRCKHLMTVIRNELSLLDSNNEVVIVKFARYLESMNIKGPDKKYFLSIEDLEECYYGRLAILIKGYLANSDINKRDFYKKHNLHSKFGEYRSLL